MAGNDQKMIDELSGELDEISQMGGDVDALKTSGEEEETSDENPDIKKTGEEDTETPGEEEEESSEEQGAETSKKVVEGEDPKQPKLKTPDPGKAKERFNRSRGNLRAEVEGMKSMLTEVLAAFKAGSITKTEAQKQVQDELDTYAEKHKLDPAGIKELVGIIEKRLKPAEKKVEAVTEEEEDDEDDFIEYNAEDEASIFDEEWTPLEIKIREQYPNATPKQIVAAKRRMDELAHSSPQFAQQDLDYIFTKHPKTFSEILFSPKKKGAESGFLGTVEEEAEDKSFTFDANNMNPKKAALLESQLDELALAEEDGGLEIMRDGEKIKV